MSLIPAEKALAQSNSFDLTQDQVLANIASLIDSNSKTGKRKITAQYLKTAVSEQELDGALAAVRSNGYVVEISGNNLDKELFTVTVSW